MARNRYIHKHPV